MTDSHRFEQRSRPPSQRDSMISKSELKVAVAAEFEQGFAGAKKAAENDALRWDGAKTSLKGVATAVEALLAHIAKDAKEGILKETEAKAAQTYVRRAVEVCRNLRLKAEVQEQRARGRQEALAMAEGMATRMGQQAQRKVDQESVGDDQVPNTRHPGNRVAELRDRAHEDPSESQPPTKEPVTEPPTPPSPGVAVTENATAKKVAKKKVAKRARQKKSG